MPLPTITPRTRIAPTPSGYLHAGNAINFLITAELAREFGGTIHLRIDDLDAERVRHEYVDDIFRSLEWLGISCDSGPIGPDDHNANWSQQRRSGRYDELALALREMDVVYGCTCTRSQLRASGSEGRYPGTCRTAGHSMDKPESAWRLHVPEGTVLKVPSLFGADQIVELERTMGDPVIRQRSALGSARNAYQLASLAEDMDGGMTFIVRGVDLLDSTACQLHIAKSLGMDPFLKVRFLHHPLETDASGLKLSKSEGATSLKAMREAGNSAEPLKQKARSILRQLR